MHQPLLSLTTQPHGSAGSAKIAQIPNKVPRLCQKLRDGAALLPRALSPDKMGPAPARGVETLPSFPSLSCCWSERLSLSPRRSQ